jgi:glycine/D-amino acid oxidase-like deaminating enzyme
VAGRVEEADTQQAYARYSYWLETSGDVLTPRPALDGSIHADVAILGAGFTGLWTAYYLLAREPSLKIVVLEREIAGFGASGRNGGWCSAGFAVSPGVLQERVGVERARAVFRALFETVDEVGRVLATESIDAQYWKGGSLRVALGRHQLPSIESSCEAYRRLGLEDVCRRLDADEVRARVRVAGALGGLYNPHCAALHPARLVRGLARVVEARGVRIHEQTEVTGVDRGRPARLRTPRGDVTAGTVVMAGEAYLSRLREFHRHLLPVYSLITLSEPLTDAQWQEIGWGNRECVASFRLTVDYLQRTADGRILFGGRGAPYHFGSRIRDEYDRHEPTHGMLQALARRWFPVLGDTRFTYVWGGPLGVTRDWMPTFGYDRATGLAWAYGYAGQGVATANLAGRTLADLITGRSSALTELPMVGHAIRPWEPEPFRWLGARYVQSGLAAADRRAETSGVAPSGSTLAERLGRH